jgi:hypothetical protein
MGFYGTLVHKKRNSTFTACYGILYMFYQSQRKEGVLGKAITQTSKFKGEFHIRPYKDTDVLI